ncbi:MAG: cell wall-binding repeat-containing protein [Coriobacteriia bacterium]
MRHSSRAGLIAIAVVIAVIWPAAQALGAAWPSGSVRVALTADRIAAPDRYGTAVAAARAGFPAWTDVTHVVIASGETRSVADALAAGGLVWAYDAPLMLVQSGALPPSVRAALNEIRSANGTVTVTVVGGPRSVSAACVTQIKNIVGASNVEQPWVTGDRFTVAAGIARRMQAVAAADSRELPGQVLIANGTDAAGFADALALSAISARTGAPVLFVTRDRVPAATSSALSSLAASETIIAGGTAVVPAAVYSAVGGTTRWAGVTRYATAVSVAAESRSRGWLTAPGVGIAGSVIDAVTGATVSGRSGEPMLFTERGRLSKPPALYLDGMDGAITSATVYGGTAAVGDAILGELRGSPTMPVLVKPAGGGLVAKYANVAVSVGINTTEVHLYAGSSLVGTKAVDPYTTVDFGKRAMPQSGVTFKVIAANPDARTTTRAATYKRLSYPAKTSIVIDKSDFRLYWVKDDVLIKAYPIAIGRVGMETPLAMWKINAKYKTDPGSVYGPRKMRMFRRVISGDFVKYVYTAYAIHGTNQEWVIGTKASHGCIRMYNRDVLELFPQVPLGTLVQTRQ